MYSMAVSYFEHQSTYFLSERKQLDVLDIISANVFQSLSLLRDKRKRVFLKFSYLSTTTAMKTTQHCIALHSPQPAARNATQQHSTSQHSAAQDSTTQANTLESTTPAKIKKLRLGSQLTEKTERFRSKVREIPGRAKY